MAEGSASRQQPVSTMPREALRPYRYGMTLLCFGGLLNWLGLFENYAEPVRYVGVACVISGAMLLVFAICCWIRPNARSRSLTQQEREDDSVHVIAVGMMTASPMASQKPPDYETVTDKPPSYDDAIRLSPALLWLAAEQERQGRQLENQGQVTADKEVADSYRHSEESTPQAATAPSEQTAAAECDTRQEPRSTVPSDSASGS